MLKRNAVEVGGQVLKLGFRGVRQVLEVGVPRILQAFSCKALSP